MPSDTIVVEILEDGTIKVITDPISAANHSNAEQFLRYMAQMAGGDTTRVRKTSRRQDVRHTNAVTEGTPQ